MFNRRKFLQAAGLAGYLPLVGRAEEMDLLVSFSPEQVRVVQGVTNATSTLISVLVHRDANMQIDILNHRDLSLCVEQNLIDLNLGEFVIHQLYVSGLVLDKTYSVLIWDKKLNRLHKRHFKALDLDRENTKVAVLTCSNHRDAKPKTNMFNQLFQVKPDVIFFPGDLVYANSAMDTVWGKPADPDKAYLIYTKTLMDFDLYERLELIPVFATWDDHDLAFNNSDINHPHKEIMRQIFRAFFPVDERVTGVSTGPGISFALEAFGMQVFFLDGRYFKEKKRQQFLGPDQMQWFRSQLAKSDKPIMLISPQQFWNYRSFAESYQRDAAREFNEFLSLIRNEKRPALFVSGDVHYSQVQEISADKVGYKSFEVTSSAFFSSSARVLGKRSKAEGQLEYYGYPNFLLMENKDKPGLAWSTKVTCVSEDSKTHFVRELNIGV